MITCEICHKEYKTDSVLEKHQRTSKFCKQGILLANYEDKNEELLEKIKELQKQVELHKQRAKKYKHYFKKLKRETSKLEL